MMKLFKNIWILFLVVLWSANVPAQNQKSLRIESWITNPDRSALFEKQADTVFFSDVFTHRWISPVTIDESMKMQGIDGFGFALTGGSAELIMKMDQGARDTLLYQLFATDGKSIGVSYLRVSIGSSDMNSFVFSYDDLPVGKTDFNLKNFSLSQDLKDVVPVLKEILAINPTIKILGSPWSAPAWMKTNEDVKGGSLRKDCYKVYAQYFVKYIQAMKAEGIPIDAITIQNEPLNKNNTPSMTWTPMDEDEFIKEFLGPAFQVSDIKTKIILFDHNCDRPDYPLTLLSDPEVAGYANGTGFHDYGGDMSALTLVHMAHPEKNLYFTEQMVTENNKSAVLNITEPVIRLIIGATQNWSRNVLLWNLAADPFDRPHTDNGGCPVCQGAITIDKNTVTHNIAYYTVAHASKFVRPGSVRIGSTQPGDAYVSLTKDEDNPQLMRVAVIKHAQVFPNVAFKTPDGKIVLIVANNTFSRHGFVIQYNGKYAFLRLRPGAVGTYIWKDTSNNH